MNATDYEQQIAALDFDLECEAQPCDSGQPATHLMTNRACRCSIMMCDACTEHDLRLLTSTSAHSVWHWECLGCHELHRARLIDLIHIEPLPGR